MKKFFKENLAYIVGGILVLTIFFLRFYHLTILPVFADETIYIRWSQVMKAEETLRFLPLSDGKEPLFMWIMIPFFKIIHDPLFAGRSVSVLSGFGTLIGVGFLSYLLFKNKKVALAAALIYAVSPFTFFFDRMSLADSMLSMFGVWTFVFAYLSVKNKRFDYSMLAGFALGGAWLTKSPALFFALMLPFILLFSKRKNLLYSIFYILVTVLIGYGFYNILRLGPNFSMIAKRNLDYVWPLTHALLSPLDPLKPWLLQSWQWLFMMGPFGIIVIWLLGYLVNFKKYWKELLVLTIWFLGPIIVQSEYAKVLTARYIFFSIPYMVIISASIFTVEKKNLIKLFAVILVFFVAQSLIFDRWLLINPEKANLPRSERSGYLEDWTAGQGIKESADYFIQTATSLKPGEHIVVGTEGYFGTLPDGLEIYLNNIPNTTVVGTGLDFRLLPSSLVNSKKSGNRTFLLVNDERFNGNADAEGLKLIASYPKATRPDGTHQSLLLFELTK